MTGGSDVLQASYAVCRRVARGSGSSFYPAMLLLPPAKRRAMEALYAFLRHTDDLADSPLPLPVSQARLHAWRQAVSAALGPPAGWPHPAAPAVASGVPADFGAARLLESEEAGIGKHASQASAGDAILPAVADTVQRYAIPPAYLWAVLDGVAMDLEHRGFETFEELAEYCRLVASAVGRACLCIWGVHRDEALSLADHCGVAFQVTNILRDVGEDAARGRAYLPRADLAACGYSIEALWRREHNRGLDRVVERLAERARAEYGLGAALFDLLDRDAQRVFGLMFSVYRHLLEEVVRCRRDLLVRRIRLGRWRKLALVTRWTLLAPRKLALL